MKASGRAGMADALRRGEPIEWVGAEDDELIPLCHSAPGFERWLPPAADPRDLHVSAIIPTGRHTPWGLGALAAQDVTVDVDVLANGAYTGGRLVAWEGHGRTRRRGVEHARHPYVLVMVDDAIPLGAGFVRTLVEGLEAGGYDAVWARQVPWPDADPVTRARLRAWTPPDGPGLATLDNVCALYRRAALLEDPFDDVPIAEDWHWGRRHRVGYVPGAPVLHSHPRRFLELYRRNRAIHHELVGAGEAPLGFTGLLRALPGSDLPGVGELLGRWRGSVAALQRRAA